MYRGTEKFNKEMNILEFTNKFKISLVFFSLVFFSFILVSSVFAYYELECKIDTKPKKIPELVTTDSFFLNITITNIGNKPFPYSEINVTIFDPNHRVIEDYYSYLYSPKAICL